MLKKEHYNMRIEELRTGNWIITQSGYTIVQYVTMKRGVYYVGHLPSPLSSGNGHGETKVSDCLPVNITRDILLYSGFFKVFITKFLFWKTNLFVTDYIAFSEDLKKTILYNNETPNTGFYIEPLIYVHDLQNLYYDLNKKHLTILSLNL